MKLYRLVFTVVLVLVCCGECVWVALAGVFKFEDLERYYLQNYQQLASSNTEDVQISTYAVQYATAHFPLGSSAFDAVSALKIAEAKCSVDDDENAPPGFVCVGSRPDHGLDYFCCQIDWLVGIDTDKGHKRINNITAVREETGP